MALHKYFRMHTLHWNVSMKLYGELSASIVCFNDTFIALKKTANRLLCMFELKWATPDTENYISGRNASVDKPRGV